MGELGGRDPARAAHHEALGGRAVALPGPGGPGLGQAGAAIEDRHHRQLQALRPVHGVVPAEQRVGLVPDAEDDEHARQVPVRDAAAAHIDSPQTRQSSGIR